MNSQITPTSQGGGFFADALASWNALNPQIKSIITSVLLAGATAVTTWAVNSGLVPAADQSTVTGDIVTGAGVLAMALIGWWKTRSHTQVAMIAAVNNADNGVKVVAASTQAATATAPLK
jgi:hypothetical protein